MRLSSLEGVVAEMVTASAGGATLTAWGLHVGASPMLLGVLVALPHLGQLAHFPATQLVGRFGVRRTAIHASAASRVFLLQLALIPLLGLQGAAAKGILVATALISALLGVIGNSAWVEWMGALVPERIRGRYFGRRLGLVTVAGAVGSLGAASIIDLVGPANRGGMLGLLALVAASAGLLSARLLSLQHAPSRLEQLEPAPMSAVVAPLKEAKTRRVVAYLVSWNAAVGVGSSFFGLYMVQSLGMSWSLVALQGTAVAIVRMLVAPYFGRLVDRVGVEPVLVKSSRALAFLPMLWVFSAPGVWWPIALEMVLAGVLWGGHGIASFQVPFASAPEQSRRFHVALYASASGLAFVLATALGGVLATYWDSLPMPPLPDALEEPMRVLFLLSGVLRLGASVFASRLGLEPERRPSPPAENQTAPKIALAE